MNLPTLLTRFTKPTVEAEPSTFTIPDGATVDAVPVESGSAFKNLITRDDSTTDAGVWAYFLLSGVDHSFVPAGNRMKVVRDQIFRWADLAGHKVWLLGTTAPYPIDAYGERLHAMDQGRDRDAPDGARTFADLVASAQGLLAGYDAKTPVTVLGVRLYETPVPAEHLPHIAGTGPIPEDLPDLADVRRRLVSVEGIVRQDGFHGRPLSAKAFQWVAHSCTSLGHSVPPIGGGGECDDAWEQVEGFDAGALATAPAYTTATRVAALRDMKEVVRYVTVQPAESFADRDLKDTDAPPWLSWAVTLDEPDIGPVTYVMVGEIIEGEKLVKKAELQVARASNQALNWDETGNPVPREVVRAHSRAVEVADEVGHGSKEIAARFRGTILFAVSGATQDDAGERARRLRQLMAREQGIVLADSYAQYSMYRAFTPGAAETAAPEVVKGHRTQMACYYLATAVPNGYATGGDKVGMPIGPVGGSTEVYMFDPHAGPARNESGLNVILGGQGAGKSTLAGAMLDWSAAMGHRTVFTDPAGMFRRICELPHNRHDSYVLDLKSANAGMAVPSLLVPEPRRQDYDTEAGYVADVSKARQDRVDTTVDVFAAMFEYQTLASADGARMMRAIKAVVGQYGAEYGADPWLLLEKLALRGEPGQDAAELLRDSAHSVGAIFFPKPGGDVSDKEIGQALNRAVITGISMQGVDVPQEGTPRELWTSAQQRSAPLLAVAGMLALRAMYADRDPKNITMDEIGIMAPGSGGVSSTLRRGAVESRKQGAYLAVLGQTPSMFTSLGDQVGGLIGTAMIGRIKDEATARAALPLLRLGDESGHEQTIMSLSQGEFLIRRSVEPVPGVPSYIGAHDDRVRRAYFDRSWLDAGLLAALDTTAGGEGQYTVSLHDELSS